MAAPTETSPSASGLERGDTVGRFVLLGLLGRGGMGEVYAAYDPELDRKVAVKLLRARTADGEARLLREAQAIAKLSHPNVVVVYDVGKFRDTVFIAMEFVDGNTLGYWMHAERRPWRETLRLFHLAGQGLAAAHGLGMVHRDFKPDNVMLTKDGHVRVMDFGLARHVGEADAEPRGSDAAPVAGPPPEADPDATMPLGNKSAPAAPVKISGGYLNVKLTQTGAQVGTPAYMAPEQFAALPTDARTNQFSFCVALYEALYGERPFAGDSVLTLMTSVSQGEVRPPPAKASVPGWIRRVLLRGLATDPGARFPSMPALLAALGKDPAAQRRKWAAALAVLVAMGGVAVAATRAGSSARSLCAGGEVRVAGVWEAAGAPSPRKEAIRAAFVATGRSYAAQTYAATARLLDAWVGQWTSLHREVCEATSVRGEQSAEVLDLRMACLSERLGNLRALTDVLAKADVGILENAPNAAGALPPLEGCSDVALLRAVVKPPTDPAIRKRVDELREELARVTALRDAGQCATAETRGARLVEAVRLTGYLPLLAEALVAVGHFGYVCGDPSVAVERFRDAYTAAVAGHHDLVAAEAATSLPLIVVSRLGQTSRAKEWVEIARASIARIGRNDRLAAHLLSSEAMVAEAEHDYEAAVRNAREALAVTQRLLGRSHPLSLAGLLNIGEILQAGGRTEEALAADREALAAAEEALGPVSSIVAALSNNECEALNSLDRFAEAAKACGRALAIWREVGVDRVIRAYGLTGLGRALEGQGRAGEAIAPLEEAVAARTAAHVTPTLIGESRFALARALWSRPADRARALAVARQARVDSASDPKTVAAIDAWLAKPVAR